MRLVKTINIAKVTTVKAPINATFKLLKLTLIIPLTLFKEFKLTLVISQQSGVINDKNIIIYKKKIGKVIFELKKECLILSKKLFN